MQRQFCVSSFHLQLMICNLDLHLLTPVRYVEMEELISLIQFVQSSLLTKFEDKNPGSDQVWLLYFAPFFKACLISSPC